MEEGRQEAEAVAVLTVLEARGFTLEAPLRQLITSCKNLAQLQRWLRKAVVGSVRAGVVRPRAGLAALS